MARISNKQFEPIWDDKDEKKNESKLQSKRKNNLKNKKIDNTIINLEPVSQIKKEDTIIIQTLTIKEAGEKYLKEGIKFKLYYNNSILYQSDIKSDKKPIFEIDYFILYDRKYPYKGIRIQKI